MRYILFLILLSFSSSTFAYDVDAPEFWDGWKRDDTVEMGIDEMIRNKRISAHQVEQLATEKNPEYSFYLALIYYYGYQKHADIVFERNYGKALQYFEYARARAFLQPYIDYYVGMIYMQGGDGVEQSYTIAKMGFEDSNTPEAFLRLALINYPDTYEQLEWYKKMAYTGEWRAIITVADWYEKGRKDLPASHEEAYYWYNMACLKNVNYACESLKRLTIESD